MYDDYGKVLNGNNTYSTSYLNDFSIPMSYLIPGVYIYNPLNKKTAYVKIYKEDNMVFEYSVYDAEGNILVDKNRTSWKNNSTYLIWHGDHPVIYTNLPDAYVIDDSGSSMKDDV